MTLKSLFKKRQGLYYKKLLKYSQYIFNDHFSLVLFFILGAGGYAYSNYLDSLSYGSREPYVFLLFIYLFLSLTGSVTLVVEEADQLYLLAKEEEFYPILKSAIFRSYLQSLVPIAFITFITYPIFTQVNEMTISKGVMLFGALASLKWFNLLVKVRPYFYQNNIKQQQYRYGLYLFSFFGMMSLIFITTIGTATVLLFLAMVTFYLFFTEKIYFDHSLKWEAMIEIEKTRLHRLYRFIELFTDVPEMDTKIKRLKNLDRFLSSLSHRYPKASYYYLLRRVARNTEYSGLVFRLTLLGGILIYSMSSYLFAVLFTVLFIYILGFQLMSLVKEIEKVPQFKIYPISAKNKVTSSLYLINQLLFFMTVVFTLVSTINLGIIGITVLPIGILAAYLFSFYYVPYRLSD